MKIPIRNETIWLVIGICIGVLLTWYVIIPMFPDYFTSCDRCIEIMKTLLEQSGNASSLLRGV